MKIQRSLYIAAALCVGIAPLATFAAWQGAPANPPNSNTSGPVWLSPISPQTGFFSVTQASKVSNAFDVGTGNTTGAGNLGVSGNVYLANDFYFTSTDKSIRVDGDGARTLRIGNYDAGSNDSFTLSIALGNPYLSPEPIRFIVTDSTGLGQICLNGSCISAWPSGGGGAGDITDVLAGTGISVASSAGPQPTVSLATTYQTGAAYDDRFVNITGDDMTGPLTIDRTASGLSFVIGLDATANNTNAGGSSLWSFGVRGQGEFAGVAGLATTNSGQGVNGQGGLYGVVGTATLINSYGGHFTGGTWGAYGTGGQYGMYGTAPTYGMYGLATAGNGIGVAGSATGLNAYGGYMTADTTGGIGVLGRGASYGGDFYGSTYGVRGAATASGGTGVYGSISNALLTAKYGVRGIATHVGGQASDVYGVYGESVGTTHVAENQAGVWGKGPVGVKGEGTTYGILSRGKLYAEDDAQVDGALTIGPGSVAAPALAFTADPDTGIYRGAANQMIFAAAGAAQAYITASGLCLGGTAAANCKTAWPAAGGSGDITDVTAGAGITVTSPGGPTPTVAITANGITATQLAATISQDTTFDGDTTFVGSESNGSSAAAVKITAGSQTMTLDGNEIDSSSFITLNHNNTNNVLLGFGGGNVGVGNSSPGTRLHVGSTSVTNGNVATFQDANGSCAINPGAASAVWTCSSDRRLKMDIRKLTLGLDKIMQLSPSVYTLKADGSTGIGFIAQDVQKVLPHLVSPVDAQGTLGVSQDGMIPYMVSAIQELKIENDSLKSQLSSLEARLEKLEKAIR